MAEADLSGLTHRFGRTSRIDAWWARPLIIFIFLSAFVVYATWAALQGKNYYFGPYLSPLYSPEIFGDSPHNWFGPKPGIWPSFLPWSPAILILWAPGLFRLTCYYYRGAYYKSFFTSPVACSVSEFGKRYTGERTFPLILQNIHRYFMYIALVFILILAHDAWDGLWFTDPLTGARHFGIGIGTLVLTANVVFLAGYTFGCHSLRHAVGGIKDRLSGSPFRRKIYMCAGCFNQRHMLWAWMSLCWVAFTDIYIRLCATGVWADWKFLF
jgi:hypothetical protein